MASVTEVASWIRDSSFTGALTGAGISTDSGISDFRGPQGLWTRNPDAEKRAHIRYYLSDRQVRVDRWRSYLGSTLQTARPNPAHFALAELERKGRLQILVTQNVDGLHIEAGSSPDITVEIHGTAREVACLDCGERAPIQRALDRVRAGEEDPDCRSCGGILKSATISFGQALVEKDLERAFEAARRCDVLLAGGTLLSVYPAAYMADIALESGARLVIINDQPTLYDDAAAAVFHSGIGDTLPRLVDKV